MQPYSKIAALIVLVAAALPAAAQAPRPGFEDRLRAHPYFSKIAWKRTDDFGAVAVWLQKPAVEKPNWERATAESLGPWCEQIEELFVRRYARPLGLERRPGHESGLFVLQSEGDYANYSKVARVARTGARAQYDPGLRVVVTFADAFGTSLPPHLRRWLGLREVVVGLMAAYAPDRVAPPPAWLREGLADHLAFHHGHEPAVLETPSIHLDYLRAMSGATAQRRLRETVAHSLTELVGITRVADLQGIVAARARASGVAAPATGEAYQVFYAEACLLNHFLQRGRDGAYAVAYLRYLQWALQGRGDLKHLTDAFEDHDLSIVESEFFEWIQTEHKVAFPEGTPENLALLLTDAVTDRPQAPAREPAKGQDPAGAQAVPEVVIPFDPALIGLAAGNLRARHGLALRVLAQGDADRAILLLEALRGGEAGDRVARELERARAWRALRDAWLADPIANGGRLRLMVGQKRVTLKIAALEDGILRFEPNREGVGEIPVAGIPAVELGQQMTRNMPSGTPRWVRCYAYVVAGDDRWERLLRDSDAASESLRADAEGDYSSLLELGEIAEHLEGLAATGVPEDAAAAVSVVTRVRALAREAAHPLVMARKDQLLRLARLAFETQIDASTGEPDLAGAWEWTGEGRIRITYEFDDPAELEDFVVDRGYLGMWRSQMDPLDVADELTAGDGQLHVQGAAGLRHSLSLRPPVSVIYDMKYEEREGNEAHTIVFAGVCGDARGNYAGASDAGYLIQRDVSRGLSDQIDPEEPEPYFMGQVYRAEVHLHDGILRSLRDSVAMAQTECSLLRGWTFLFVHAGHPIVFDRVIIEGELDDDARAEMRAHWIESQLAGLGL